MTPSEFEEENGRKFRELTVKPGNFRATNHIEQKNTPEISLDRVDAVIINGIKFVKSNWWSTAAKQSHRLSSAGSASPLHGEGQEFEPLTKHQNMAH